MSLWCRTPLSQAWHDKALKGLDDAALALDGRPMLGCLLLPFAPAFYDQFDIRRAPVLAELVPAVLPPLLLTVAYHKLSGHTQQRLWEICDHAIRLARRMGAHLVFGWTGTALVRKPSKVQRRFDVFIRQSLSIRFPSYTAFLCQGERVLSEIEHVTLLDKEVGIRQDAFGGSPQEMGMSLQGEREPLVCQLEIG